MYLGSKYVFLSERTPYNKKIVGMVGVGIATCICNHNVQSLPVSIEASL